MNKSTLSIMAAGLGAGLMYLFDPDKGRRRRTMAQDKINSARHSAGDLLLKARHDIGNRAQGLMADASAKLRVEEVSDDHVVARVRAAMGHIVSHPHAITVTAENGVVDLRGPILAPELQKLLGCVRRVKGVQDVHNHLESHDHADLPQLQGGTRRLNRPTFWSPAKRLLLGATGGTLAAYGAVRKGAVGMTLGALGTGVLTRALTVADPAHHATHANGACARSSAPDGKGTSVHETTSVRAEAPMT